MPNARLVRHPGLRQEPGGFRGPAGPLRPRGVQPVTDPERGRHLGAEHLRLHRRGPRRQRRDTARPAGGGQGRTAPWWSAAAGPRSTATTIRTPLPRGGRGGRRGAVRPGGGRLPRRGGRAGAALAPGLGAFPLAGPPIVADPMEAPLRGPARPAPADAAPRGLRQDRRGLQLSAAPSAASR